MEKVLIYCGNIKKKLILVNVKKKYIYTIQNLYIIIYNRIHTNNTSNSICSSTFQRKINREWE